MPTGGGAPSQERSHSRGRDGGVGGGGRAAEGTRRRGRLEAELATARGDGRVAPAEDGGGAAAAAAATGGGGSTGSATAYADRAVDVSASSRTYRTEGQPYSVDTGRSHRTARSGVTSHTQSSAEKSAAAHQRSARRKQRGQAADEEYYYQEQGGSSHKDPYTDLRRIRSFTADPDFA